MTPLEKLLEEYDKKFAVPCMCNNTCPVHTHSNEREFISHTYTLGEEAGLKAGRASMAEEVREKIRNIFYKFNDREEDFGCNQKVLKLRNEIIDIINQLEKE